MQQISENLQNYVWYYVNSKLDAFYHPYEMNKTVLAIDKIMQAWDDESRKELKTIALRHFYSQSADQYRLFIKSELSNNKNISMNYLMVLTYLTAYLVKLYTMKGDFNTGVSITNHFERALRDNSSYAALPKQSLGARIAKPLGLLIITLGAYLFTSLQYNQF